LELRPAELFGGPAAVAVRAANVAFCDLELNDRPGALTDHPGDRLSLQRRVAMIELQNDRINLAAVDAGVGDQIVEDLLAAFFPIGLPLRSRALQIRRTISSVVLA
jgi:hypothetical protein